MAYSLRFSLFLPVTGLLVRQTAKQSTRAMKNGLRLITKAKKPLPSLNLKLLPERRIAAMNDPKKVQQLVHTVGTGAQLLAAITSCFILYVIIRSQMPEHWPQWANLTLTALMVGGVVSIIELFPRAMLPGSLDILFSPKDGREWLFVAFSLLICLGLQSVSVLTSYHSRELIAQSIVKAPKIVNTGLLAVRKDSIKEQIRADYRAEIAALESSEAKRIKEAKNQSASMLRNAIHSGGANLATLYYQGNGWAKDKLSRSINQAKTKGAVLVDLEQKKVAILKQERDSRLEKIESENQTLLGTVKDQNTTLSDRYEAQIRKYEGAAVWVGIGGSIVFLIMQIFASLHRMVEGLELVQETTAPPLLHAVFGIFARINNSLSRGLYWLAENEEMKPVQRREKKSDFNRESPLTKRERLIKKVEDAWEKSGNHNGKKKPLHL